MRHATELQARIGISNGKCSKEIPFIFLFSEKEKCGMTRVAFGARLVVRRRRLRVKFIFGGPRSPAGCTFRFLVCCSPTAAGMRQQSAAVGRRRTARLRRAADIMTEMFSGRGLRRAQRCECRCRPPRAEAAARTTLTSRHFLSYVTFCSDKR